MQEDQTYTEVQVSDRKKTEKEKNESWYPDTLKLRKEVPTLKTIDAVKQWWFEVGER
jgi:hypothetical protein